MIVVELKRPRADGVGYRVAAVLVVDGSAYELRGEQLDLVDVPVLIADQAEGTYRQVHLAEEPETWARNAERALRTGYLVPVIHEEVEDASAFQPEPETRP